MIPWQERECVYTEFAVAAGQYVSKRICQLHSVHRRVADLRADMKAMVRLFAVFRIQ